MIFIFTLIAFPVLGMAEGYTLDEIVIDCEYADECKEFSDLFQTLSGEPVDKELIREKTKFALKDPQINSLEYRLYNKEDQKKSLLIVQIKLKKRISRITYEGKADIPFDLILPYLSVKEGGVLDESKIPTMVETIKSKLVEKGYRGITVEPSVLGDDYFVGLKFKIDYQDVVKVGEIDIGVDYDSRRADIYRSFRRFKDKVWDKVDTKVVVDRLTESFFREGFYFSRVQMDVEDVDEKSVRLKIGIKLDKRYNFSFRGNRVFSRGELIEAIEKKLKNEVKMLSPNMMSNFISELYMEQGVYNTNVSISLRSGKTKKGMRFENFYIDVNEGNKITLSQISYSGNKAISIERLQKIYEQKGSVLASRGYLDTKFLETFSSLIKEEYLSKGFVFVEVSKPEVEIGDERKKASVKYKIKEKQPVAIAQINLNGIPDELKKDVLPLFINKEGDNINLIELQSDIERLQSGLRELGYYFATIKNVSQGGIVSYNKSFTEANINLDVDLQKKTVFDGLLITGTQFTKNEVIEREIDFKKGDPVTPNKLEDLKNRLTALGLFSLVRISPYVVNKSTKENTYRTNVLIQLREKDFGTFEFAPGFRTDLGAKLSMGINYGNIGGYNHTIGFKGQVNQRLDSSNINSIRRASYEKMMEFLARANYNWPYVLGSKFEIDFSAQFQRRRYFDFDADILRSSAQISRVLWDYTSRDFRSKKVKRYQLTGALKYQFETISQYQASDEIDNDYFRIGGITPSLDLDLRDDPIDPRFGAYFGLSWEFANPTLQSIEDEDLIVDFHKVVSRNKFYYSFGHLTLALSTSFGVQKNNASELKNGSNTDTTGYIPSIKVFRLDGVDTVRGYSNEEINVLSNQQDIGDVIIRSKAYFANIKFEPRFRVTDNFIIGPFIDAGRVYINSFKPLDLRTSTGLTMKLLTPVGSLDFDYGVKLKRKIKPNGDNEQFGRFHLSIGFF